MDEPTEHAPPIVELARGDGWIVVAKPPRVVIHRSRHTREEYAALQRTRDLVGDHVYPVHRLDRPASGCLLFATDRSRTGELHEALKLGRKTYLAFTRGQFAPEGEVVVETDIVNEGQAKEARSVVDCLGTGADPRCSLLRVRPETGRHHQVRRHVRDLHHPILGDRAHGDHRENKIWRERGLTRLGLHAFKLELELPEGTLSAVCPLFQDMYEVLSQLPWWARSLDLEPDLGRPFLPWRDQVPPPDLGHGEDP